MLVNVTSEVPRVHLTDPAKFERLLNGYAAFEATIVPTAGLLALG